MLRNKKAPWPTLPLWIILYEIKNLKFSNSEAKDIMKFELGTKDFNLYDPLNIGKDQCTIVYFPWISSEFHCPKEDPWRYYCNSSRLNESVSVARTLKIAPKIAVALEETSTTVGGSNLIQDKGNRNIFYTIMGEKSYKMKVDLIIAKEPLEVEAKREKQMKREEWRKR